MGGFSPFTINSGSETFFRDWQLMVESVLAVVATDQKPENLEPCL